jgi:hypothetical protein
MNQLTLGLCALMFSVLGGCAVVPDGMVAVRAPGQLTFAPPVALESTVAADTAAPPPPAHSYAQELYPYAAMAENVYHPRTSGDAPQATAPKDAEAVCVPGSSLPLRIGEDWRLQDFPSNADALDDENNLRMQLWARQPALGGPRVEVVAVFRGTEARHGKDWRSNLRWLLRPTVDHYTLTSDVIAPALRDWLQAKIDSGEVAPNVRLVAVGRSLGGGLAQRLAYSFRAPPNATDMRMSRVYAFDPSPVTGWASTDKALREHNADGMLIDRVLEDGEALSYLRDLIAIFLPPSEARPAIRGMKFNFKHSLNPLSNHSMRLIACALAKYAIPGARGLETAPLEAQSQASENQLATAVPWRP